jgi:hypothetical protein
LWLLNSDLGLFGAVCALFFARKLIFLEKNAKKMDFMP